MTRTRAKYSARHLLTSLTAMPLVLTLTFGPALAEVKELRIAYQHSMAFLVVDVMLSRHMIEARAKAAGLDEIKVSAVQFASGPAANDALLKGEIEVGGAGLTPFLDLWSRTRGGENVRAIAPINDSPLYLITCDDRVKSAKDLTVSDKIVVPAPGSIQGLFVRMVADRDFGKPDHLDQAMVSMTGATALKALGGADDARRTYVASIPFNLKVMQLPGARELETSYAMSGGAHSLVLLFATQEFKTENPKLYLAISAAIDDAMDFIKSFPKETAEIFAAASRGTTVPEEVLEVLRRSDVAYSPVPRGTMKFAAFMYKIGMLKEMPASWRDVYWENVHGRDGS